METLMKEVLVRERLDATVSLDKTEQAILSQAWDKLGYSPRDAATQKARSDKEAAVVFTKLGIEPFSQSSVDKYKQQMLDEMNFWWNVSDFFSDNWGAAIMVISAIAAIGSIATVFFAHFGDNKPWFFGSIPFMIAVPLVTVAAITMIYLACKHFIRYEWNWTEISAYKDKIPAFALMRAMAVRGEYPSAGFWVEHLRERSSEPMNVDPFLVVNIGGSFYYVDVWDEPKFEGRRVV